MLLGHVDLSFISSHSLLSFAQPSAIPKGCVSALHQHVIDIARESMRDASYQSSP